MYFRPHNISTVDKSNIKAKVIKSIFLESHYKITAKFNKDIVILFNHEYIEKIQ